MQASEIAQTYEPAIRRWFAARVVSREDAEDLTQEAVMAVLRGWHRFDARSSVPTWVYAICRNTLFTSVRRQTGRAKRAFTLDNPAALEELPARADDIETRVLVRMAVRTLPERLQSLYLLRYERGMSISEIATQLGRSEGTIKSQFFEMRARLSRLVR